MPASDAFRRGVCRAIQFLTTPCLPLRYSDSKQKQEITMLKVEMLSTGDEVYTGKSLTLTLPGWPIFSFIRAAIISPQYGGG